MYFMIATSCCTSPVLSRMQMVSCDSKGFVKYWDQAGKFPTQGLKFKSMFSTDLMACVKDSVVPKNIAVSKCGRRFVLACSDNTFRVFSYATGKCIRKFDASIQVLHPKQLYARTQLRCRSPYDGFLYMHMQP